jgi:hypothetical protein
VASRLEDSPGFLQEWHPLVFGNGQLEERYADVVKAVSGEGKAVEKVALHNFDTRDLGIIEAHAVARLVGFHKHIHEIESNEISVLETHK